MSTNSSGESRSPPACWCFCESLSATKAIMFLWCWEAFRRCRYSPGGGRTSSLHNSEGTYAELFQLGIDQGINVVVLREYWGRCYCSPLGTTIAWAPTVKVAKRAITKASPRCAGRYQWPSSFIFAELSLLLSVSDKLGDVAVGAVGIGGADRHFLAVVPSSSTIDLGKVSSR